MSARADLHLAYFWAFLHAAAASDEVAGLNHHDWFVQDTGQRPDNAVDGGRGAGAPVDLSGVERADHAAEQRRAVAAAELHAHDAAGAAAAERGRAPADL